RIVYRFESKLLPWVMPCVLTIFMPVLLIFMQRPVSRSYSTTLNLYGRMWSIARCISLGDVVLYTMGFLRMEHPMTLLWYKRFIRPMEDLTNFQMLLLIPKPVQT